MQRPRFNGTPATQWPVNPNHTSQWREAPTSLIGQMDWLTATRLLSDDASPCNGNAQLLHVSWHVLNYRQDLNAKDVLLTLVNHRRKLSDNIAQYFNIPKA